MIFDLQSHSTVSDGALPPAEVVKRAAAAGVELLALTDHDAVDGIDEALAEAAARGIRVTPATELSALDAESEDFHILGYEIAHQDPSLTAALHEFRADRNARGARMAQALEELGFALERAPLDARAAQDLPIGRPHLAAAVLAHPANAARVAAEGLTDVGAVIEAYLVPGAPAYRTRTMPTVPEAIALIHEAGGVAVWAHPFWDLADDEQVLATLGRFVAAQLDGVETFYVTHDERQTRLLHARATELGLLTTGSSDFHGPQHGLFSGFRAFATHGLEPNLGPLGEV
ncbi:MAG TPA: PHP domain-containing protein [Solirubrobacteraceae bacterium]